jgi:hypothetical protein
MARIPRIPFHFHAEGHAFSGEIHHPFWYPIKAKASTSLPTIGGHAMASYENFQCHEFASFKKAHTHVSGRKIDDLIFETHATTTVEYLNIEGVLTADRIVCRLSSRHDPEHPEGLILATGSRFENLRIRGHEVKVILRHKLLEDCDNFEKLHAKVKGERDSGKGSGKLARYDDGATICTLVERIETTLPDVVKEGDHVLEVPDFGKVTIAEIFAVQGSRTLTMLHLELGSPQTANLTVAEDGTNGRPYPPPP